MKKVISTEKIPIKMWLDDIEEGALQQARNLANLPFAFHHVAIMADAHFGYGMPIGGVLATDEVVIPNAVGVDIGCGVCCLQTSLTDIEDKTLRSILGAIRKTIPTGFKHHRCKQDEAMMPKAAEGLDSLKIVSQEYESALAQLGTLGGGNHFIEIQKGSDNHIWVMIHSGSRNLGYRVANHYNSVAVKLNKKWKSPVNPKWQLAYLPLSSATGWNYLVEMQYCVDFALCNRLHMLQQVKTIFEDHAPEIRFAQPLNVAHNYAAREKHFGQDLIIHRKGATRAFAREMGVIPGSQGMESYIVRGLGNRESFCSCSHGAGRKLGRKQAQRTLKLQEEIDFLEKRNILHEIRSKKDLDEAAGAYKDIHSVIASQDDLIEVVTELKPLAVIKG
ncbi:MAG: RtcB family protein [Desulfocapsaceae bacterium]|nr:RtcB family protein [Desulfocapsaceae bacterium]